jgi:hypothetical protein
MLLRKDRQAVSNVRPKCFFLSPNLPGLQSENEGLLRRTDVAVARPKCSPTHILSNFILNFFPHEKYAG